MSNISQVMSCFFQGWRCGGGKMKRQAAIKKDKELRDNLSEKQIDHAIEDSFPASDPPSTY